jgi:hypothetical protein
MLSIRGHAMSDFLSDFSVHFDLIKIEYRRVNTMGFWLGVAVGGFASACASAIILSITLLDKLAPLKEIREGSAAGVIEIRPHDYAGYRAATRGVWRRSGS